ncbi:acylphosphatase [Synchytrium microbalum]|uniref:acylphosphatase n=1 Tax=Synchytrium microbalum TaxID=1806994 RepID=A0A507CFR7_9FUNG|nr:acylphosphatase [Synchytrium microbalum]TPX36353.1 acylphosphatase [Synchytrium microbalum]
MDQSLSQSHESLWTVTYKITGKVQGVFFRKYTAAEAQRLDIKGTVCNHADGSVVGIAQGPKRQIDLFKEWVSTKGSPKSRIDNFSFTEERELSSLQYKTFGIVK